MGFVIQALTFFSIAALTYTLVPALSSKYMETSHTRSQRLAGQMERALMRSEIKRMMRFYVAAPIIFGAAGFLLFPEELRLIGVLAGVVVGFLAPSFYVNGLIRKKQKMFADQLIDALLIMSSSFRGGLSLIQAMEAVVEEMGDPIASEFGTVLGENKMGVSLDEALTHLYQRIPSPALQQMITAILLARETGGNLPAIFSRIVTSIREKRKIQQNLETLTLQGKIQGAVMSLLPIGFAVVVYSVNPRFLQNMLNSELGRVMLIYALISECIGAFLIWKISTLKEI